MPLPLGNILSSGIELIGGLLGGSQQNNNAQDIQRLLEQISGNVRNAYQPDPFSSQVTDTGRDAYTQLSQALGLTPGSDFSQGLDRFRGYSGYQDQLQAGSDAITGSAAARGLLGSGSTARGLTGYGQRLADSSYNDYLNRLLGLGSTGLGQANYNQQNRLSSELGLGNLGIQGLQQSQQASRGGLVDILSGLQGAASTLFPAPPSASEQALTNWLTSLSQSNQPAPAQGLYAPSLAPRL